MIGAAKNEIFDSTAIDACFLERTSFFLTVEKIVIERDVCKDLKKIPEGKNHQIVVITQIFKSCRIR
jgi:hypothetical protein